MFLTGSQININILGFGLIGMAISTYPMRTIYRNFYKNTGPEFESSTKTSS